MPPESSHPKTRAVAEANLPWGAPSGTIYTLVLFFAAQFAAALLFMVPKLFNSSYNGANTLQSGSVFSQFVYVVLAEGLTLAGVYWWLKRHRTGLGIIGFKRPHWRDLGYGLAALPIYLLLYGILLGVSAHLTHINVNQQQDIGFTNVHGQVSMLLAFISLVVLPPLTEEIMVRGLLFGSLKKALPVVQAALLTSVLFASAHLPEGGSNGPLWVAAVDTFTLSLVLCYLRQKTGSLWSCITLHALKNGIAFVALFVIGIH